MRTPLPPSFAGLYAIAGPPAGVPDPARATVRLARDLLDAGVGVLQLRDKRSGGRELVRLARELRGLAAEAGALFLVNDRLDVALAAGADGVHVGQDDLSVADVRRVAAQVLGPRARGFVVGLSTHDPDQVREALAAGADYLGYGPVFDTATKENPSPVQGCDKLAHAVALAGEVPVVAIGGITLERVAQVARTGARLAAVISDIACAPDPRSRAAAVHAAFLAAVPRR